MVKSLNAWAVAPGTDFETMFKELSKAGFDAVELNVDADNSSGHSLTIHTTDAEFREILDMSKTYNLPIASISTALYWKTPLGSEKKSDREAAKNVLRTQIYAAKALETDAILVVTGGIDDNTSLAHCYERCHKELESMQLEIEASGVTVGLENVGNGFFLSPGDMCEFIDSFDSPAIGAYFDVGNVLRYSYPEYWIEVLGSRIVRVHAKDGKKVPLPIGYYEYPLLQGSVRWDRVMTSLRQAGYEGPFTAETGSAPQAPDLLYRMIAAALERIGTL